MKAKILGIIMAGGEGSRLAPLTRDRAKPAVPFGGKYRIIDFVLSNFVNSEVYSIYVLVQFKCQSLIEHLQERWRFGGLLHDQFISSVPAQMWKGQTWYQGNADAVYQNLHLIENFKPDFVLIFGADHIYRMDVRQMVTFHLEKQADVTIAAFPVPVAEGPSFGILQVDHNSQITGFMEKPAAPTPLPNDPGYCLASMGNYLFSTELLVDLLQKDKHEEEQGHDFGRHILPPLIGQQQVYAYDFRHNRIAGEAEGHPYWRDVGTLDAYYAASMDLRGTIPALNLYNPLWPIHTGASTLPPAKFTHDGGGQGTAIQSVVSEGCIINGATIVDSVLGPDVRAQSHSRIEGSVIMSGCRISRNAYVRRAILDKNVVVPEGEYIGWNLDLDRQRFSVSDSGIVVVPKGYNFSTPP